MIIDADMVLTGGKVITMDPEKSRAEAIAIKGDKFLRVGGKEEIKETIGKRTEVRDVKGITIVPGFNDAHNHVLPSAISAQSLNLREVTAHSIKDILNLVGGQTKQQKEGTWIIAEGFNQNELEEKRHITCWELDEVSPNHFVYLKHVSRNMGVVNSNVLALLGIKKDTPDFADTEIIKDPETGEPTGLLNSHPRCSRLVSLIPRPSYEDLIRALKWVNQLYLSQGITSATDAGTGMDDFPYQIAAYQEAVESEILNVRMNLSIWSRAFLDFANLDEDLKEIEHKLFRFGIRSSMGNEKLRIGPFKAVIDGPLSGGGAAMHKPYGVDVKSQSTGVMAIEGRDLKKLVSVIHRLGWQWAIHAIGDRAIDEVLDAYEAALEEKPKPDHRHRIEHVYAPTAQAMARIKRLGVLCIMQPGFIWELGDSFIRCLGQETAKTFPFRSMLNNGVFVAFSSDRPVTSTIGASPLLGIHAAVNQKTMSGQEYAPTEKISPEEALRLYTINGAYTTFQENIKGSIKAERLADLVLLDEDPTKIEPERIKDISVIATILGGKFVYQK